MVADVPDVMDEWDAQRGFAPLALRYLGVRERGIANRLQQKGNGKMTVSSNAPRRRRLGLGVGCLLGGVAAATIAVPSASAQPNQCTADALAGTVSSVSGAARAYLAAHPGANQAVTAASTQPRSEASANLRGYFAANPREYYDLRGILAPIGDAQRQCNVTVLSPDLASAYAEFMAG